MIKVMSISFWMILLCLFLPKAKAQKFKNADDLFKAPKSGNFGFNDGYQPKNLFTHYRISNPALDNSDDLTQAWFDISNNNIVCSVNANGLVEYPSVMGPLSGFEEGKGQDNYTGDQP